MRCKPICKLCKRLVISTAVSFIDGTGLIVTLPAGSYLNGEKYCIVIAQQIPTATTITSPVFIRIGAGTTNYPLLRCDCSQATACNIRTRTRYSTRVDTSPTGGSFKLLGRVCCNPDYDLPAITG